MRRAPFAVLATGVLAFLSGPVQAQGIINTYAGASHLFTGDGQRATSLYLSNILAVSLDARGNPIIATPYLNVVLRVNGDGTVTRLAGTGDTGSPVDGQKATASTLYAPQAAAYDAAGNLYIADSYNNRIEKVGPDGTISAFAGNGQPGFSGDTGPAARAQLSAPTAVLADNAGNLYINDEGNQRIRKVNTQGIISTFVGGGSLPFDSSATSALLGTQISLAQPGGIALDRAGNLYVADFGGQRVLEIDAQTDAITNIAGTGSPGTAQENIAANTAPLSFPGGVAIDNAGTIYISDAGNFRILKITRNVISTYAGIGRAGYSGDGGPARLAAMSRVFGVAVDAQSNLFLADRDNLRLRRVDAATQIISTVAGTSEAAAAALAGFSSGNGVPAGALLLFQPGGLSLAPNGSLYIGDSGNAVVRRVSPAGAAFTVAGTGSSGFTGDGGQATSAQLGTPYGSALDSQGSLYIADSGNHRIRKVDTSGIITTVVGTGAPGYNGDGIPASQAQLSSPSSVVFDSAGNLYIADFGNNRVRKVSNGKISTVAGPQALNGPATLTFDLEGNLLIADSGNGQIRRLAPDGTLSTIAGAGRTGIPYPASNGAPARNAALGEVLGVAVDSAGNIYFSDATNSVVERITPNGTLEAVAGTGRAGFSASDDGGPATSAQLNFPTQVAVDASGNVFIADYNNNRIRIVTPKPPTFTATPNPILFDGTMLSQTLTLTPTFAGMSFTASVSPGTNWVTVSPQSGIMPATLTVTLDLSQFPFTQSYGADLPETTPSNAPAITINAPRAVPSSQIVPISLGTIPAAPPPARLSSDTSQLAYALAHPGSPSTTTVRINNPVSGTILFSVKAKTDDGGSWLKVSSASGSTAPGQPFTLGVTADPASLKPGTYTGSVILTDTADAGDTLSIAVSASVTAQIQTILLSDAGLTFTAVAGGGVPPPQSFAVINAGAGIMNWNVSAAPLDAGLNWLSATPTQGASTAGQIPPAVGVRVNAAGLAAGTYYGQIAVRSATAQNSPQVLTVVLNVLAADQDPGPVLQPTGLIFTGVAGGSNPLPQTVAIYNLTASPLIMGSSRTYVGAAKNWFQHDQIDATIVPGTPLVITVTPQIAGLTAGVYLSSLSLAFSDGLNRAVAIRLILAPSGSSVTETAGAAGSRLTASAVCTPTRLIPLFTSVPDGSSFPGSWPQQIVVAVYDDCANPLTSGSVEVHFSDGDAQLPLISLRDGRWVATWTPAHNGSNTVITAVAHDTTQTLTGTATLSGGIQANDNAPALTATGVISLTGGAAGAPLAPGEFISLYGAHLAPDQVTARNLPYETSLLGVSVLLDLQPLPVQYVSQGQINAIIPYGIQTNTQHSLVVQNNNRLTSVVQVTIADSFPTVFFNPEQGGNAQGAVTDPNGVIYDASHPASAGDGAVIYCVGLGGVDDRSVSAGAESPASPYANAVIPVSVTVGGRAAPRVLFQGLAPGYAGLYQVNIVIPDGVPAGNAVPVVVSSGGRSSNPVMIAIR